MYTLKKGDVTLEVNLNLLEIRSLKIKDVEMCYQQDGAWKKNWPFLFPVVGRLKEDKITYENKDYKMPRHGFFRDIKNFAVEYESDGIVTFSAKSNGAFKDVYPFEFEVKNQIEINGNEVILSYEVINLEEEKEMIFTMGHHPAFISKKSGVITFEKEEQFTKKADASGLFPIKPTYEEKIKQVKISDLSFDNGDCYFTQDLNSSWVTYEDDERKLKMSLEDYDVFLLWSASNDEDFICLEPWLGIADPYDKKNTNFEEKPRMIKIKSNDSYTCELKLELN